MFLFSGWLKMASNTEINSNTRWLQTFCWRCTPMMKIFSSSFPIWTSEFSVTILQPKKFNVATKIILLNCFSHLCMNCVDQHWNSCTYVQVWHGWHLQQEAESIYGGKKRKVSKHDKFYFALQEKRKSGDSSH